MKNYIEEKENTLIVINDTEIINSFAKAINSAKQEQGIVGRDPDYKIEIGKESYLLWKDDKRAVMTKEEDNRTIFTLSNSSSKKINEILR